MSTVRWLMLLLDTVRPMLWPQFSLREKREVGQANALTGWTPLWSSKVKSDRVRLTPALNLMTGKNKINWNTKAFYVSDCEVSGLSDGSVILTPALPIVRGDTTVASCKSGYTISVGSTKFIVNRYSISWVYISLPYLSIRSCFETKSQKSVP